jgi:hypothetical protein
MGQRPNAQGLDLNRDFMKLEAPESRALVALIREVDAHLVVDLHTTNGSYHAYHLTYAPPLHPLTDPAIDEYLRQTWLPAVTRAAAPEWLLYYYGNLPDAGVDGANEETAPRAWYTYDHRPRFGINYVGLTGRFGILSEAYSYLPFEERARVTHAFVTGLLDHAAAQGEEVRATLEAARVEEPAGLLWPLRASPARSAEAVEILLADVVEERHPWTGLPMLRRTDDVRTERMPEYGRFEGTESERVPRTYVVPRSLTAVLELLSAHGIETATPEGPPESLEVFRITASRQAEREFQGHRARTIEGRWEAVDVDALAAEMPLEDVVLVPMGQPLARLAFLLLEPRSDDGLVTWNVLDAALEGAEHYPIVRVPAD